MKITVINKFIKIVICLKSKCIKSLKQAETPTTQKNKNGTQTLKILTSTKKDHKDYLEK